MAYQYGRFQQPKIGSGYRYGSGDDIGGFIPSSLAAASQQRNATLNAQHNLWEQSNANAIAMRQRQAALENEMRAKRQDQRQRNIMGISPLSEQLADENSAAFQSVYEDVHAPTGDVSWKTAEQLGDGIQMSVGGLDGSAPAPIGVSPLSGRRMRREIRPEFAEAQERLGVPSTRTLTTDEFAERESIRTNLKMQIERIRNDNRLTLDQKKAAVEAAIRGANMRSSDPTNIGKGNEIAGNLVSDVEEIYADIPQTPAATPTPAPRATPAPTPAPATQGEIQMDVTNDQVLNSDPTGTVVRGEDGRIYFLPKGTENRIDITDRYSG